MTIIHNLPFGMLYTGMDDLSDLLDIDHSEDPNGWVSVERLYDNNRSVFHVHPNKGAHTAAMMDDEEGLPMSCCECKVGYDSLEDGTLQVIHNYEQPLAVG